MAQVTIIKDEKAIDAALNAPKALIFKNSPLCPISSMAQREFEIFAEQCDDTITLFMVDVVRDRELSREIARRTNVDHQSPQVILLDKGKVAWSESHRQITHTSLERNVDGN